MNLWFDNTSRNTDILVLNKFLKDGDTYIDAGTNIGQLVVHASRIVGGSGKVFGFEPSAKLFSFLKENVERNSSQNTILYNGGLGNIVGETYLTDKKADDQNSVQKTAQEGEKNLLTTLDTYFQEKDLKKVDLLKIDVEGYELYVLQGGLSLLEKTRVVYIELADQNAAKFGYKVEECTSILKGLGFGFYDLDQYGKLTQIDQSTYDFSTTKNLIAIQDKDILLYP